MTKSNLQSVLDTIGYPTSRYQNSDEKHLEFEGCLLVDCDDIGEMVSAVFHYALENLSKSDCHKLADAFQSMIVSEYGYYCFFPDVKFVK